jgi:predicted glutamine amidotransferase
MEDAATATTRLRMTARWISQSVYQRIVRYRRNAEHVHSHGWGLAEYLMQDRRRGYKFKDWIARD